MAADGAAPEPRRIHVDPYRATLGLAAAAVERGARDLRTVGRARRSRSAARRLTCSRPPAPFARIAWSSRPACRRRSSSRSRGTSGFGARYLALTEPVPAKIRKQLGTRHDGRPRLGRSAAHDPLGGRRAAARRRAPTAESPPARLREKTIVQRTGQLMYELSTLYPDISGIQPAYGWESAVRADRRRSAVHRRRTATIPHHLFAFGDSSPSVTGAYLAEPHPAAPRPRRGRAGRRGASGSTGTADGR